MVLAAGEQVKFMQEALYEAQKAAAIGEVPIGCVVVRDGRVIGRGHNLREHSEDATMHAEIMAIQEANAALDSWRLVDCDLFVTLEPCPMCCGAIINSRIRGVYYGAPDKKAGAAGTLMNLLTDSRFNHQAEVYPGVLQEQCAARLTQFFQEIRRKQRLARRRAKRED